jgi:hypothetical protein
MNDSSAHIADQFYQWDHEPNGFRNTSLPRSPRSIVDVNLRGAKSVDLSPRLCNAFKKINGAEAGNAPIYRLANVVVDLKFTDANVRRVVLNNDAAGLDTTGELKIQAVQRIIGSWKTPEDWSKSRQKVFCSDKPEERIEALVLIYCNDNTTSRELERREDQTGQPIDETIDSAVLVPRPGTSTATVQAVNVGSSTGCSQSIDLASGPIDPMESRITVEFASGTYRLSGSSGVAA